jgi:hypothetical protein
MLRHDSFVSAIPLSHPRSKNKRKYRAIAYTLAAFDTFRAVTSGLFFARYKFILPDESILFVFRCYKAGSRSFLLGKVPQNSGWSLVRRKLDLRGRVFGEGSRRQSEELLSDSSRVPLLVEIVPGCGLSDTAASHFALTIAFFFREDL